MLGSRQTEPRSGNLRISSVTLAASLAAVVALISWAHISGRMGSVQRALYRAAIGEHRTTALPDGSDLSLDGTSVGPGDGTATGLLTTRLGEHRCEKLPDESQACLNSNSAVHYTFGRSTRNVELLSGEASFVPRKEDRPFNVLAGGVLISGPTTSVDVYKQRKATLVTVIEGRVRVAAPVSDEARLRFNAAESEGAGKGTLEIRRLQQVEFNEVSGMLHLVAGLTEERLAQLLAWQRGQINLNGMTLEKALAEFARYQAVVKFNYQDSSIREFRVGGTMEFTHLDDFLRALEKDFRIHHTMTGTDRNAVVTFSHQRDPEISPEN